MPAQSCRQKGARRGRDDRKRRQSPNPPACGNLSAHCCIVGFSGDKRPGCRRSLLWEHGIVVLVSSTDEKKKAEKAADRPLEPRVFGKYCLLERVSVGGMAEVFRSRPLDAPNFKRFLALKKILPNLAEDTEFISMFIDEARIAVQLHHPNVCQIYELGRLQGSFYIVMEFIAGKDLLALQNHHRRRRRIMGVAQAAHIIAQVCSGLDYAHTKKNESGEGLGIVHRDISPQNVIVGYDGTVKLIDFGIARAATRNEQTQVGVLKGKFGYMSPEQVAGEEIDHRSDVFAVGTLFWELLTARRLFHGGTDFEILEQVRAADVLPPSAKNRLVPPEVDRIVAKALARDRDERYQSAAELRADLKAFLQQIRPPFTSKTMAGWMQTSFTDDIEHERKRVHEASRFVSEADVIEWERQNSGTPPDTNPGTTEPGSGEQILAENDMAPLSTVMHDTTDDGLPRGLGSVVRAVTPASSSHTVRLEHRHVADRRRWPVGAAAAALLVGLAFILLLAKPWSKDAPLPPADLAISVVPSEGVQVFVDGTLVGTQSPLRVEDIRAETARVEIRHPDYEPFAETVTLVANDTVRFHRRLTVLPGGTGRVLVAQADDATRVFADGQEVDAAAAVRGVSFDAGATHVIEIYQPGHFVSRHEVDVVRGSETTVEGVLRPVEGTIVLRSAPAAAATLNGEDIGTTESSITLENLAPFEVHQIRLEAQTPGFVPHEEAVVFGGAYNRQISVSLRRIGQEATPPQEWGTLVVDVQQPRWARILVDGRDTGATTLSVGEVRIPVAAGARVVSFAAGDDATDVPVNVDAGGTVEVTPPLPE